MGKVLQTLRDLTIILAIYLYFISWVYVRFYYEQFGISANDVNIDFDSYLMYSYNVVTSPLFLKNALAFLTVTVCIIMAAIALLNYKPKNARALAIKTSLFAFITRNEVRFFWLLFLFISVIIFKPLFQIARQVAIEDYHQNRNNTTNLKTIQFIFRKDADMLSPAVTLDSVRALPNDFTSDVKTIKNDQQQLLRYLGESNDYYIVLSQVPPQKGETSSGCVYFIDKKDVLIAKILLRSN